MRYTEKLNYFQRPIFFIEEENGTKKISTTTLESFLREYFEGDPARAWYVEKVEVSKPIFHNDSNNEREEDYNDGSREEVDLPDEFVTSDKFEVRERDNHKMSGYRLVDTFEAETEANEYHLNRLLWNFCESNRCNDAPYHADTREECEDELRMIEQIAKEK